MEFISKLKWFIGISCLVALIGLNVYFYISYQKCLTRIAEMEVDIIAKNVDIENLKGKIETSNIQVELKNKELEVLNQVKQEQETTTEQQLLDFEEIEKIMYTKTDRDILIENIIEKSMEESTDAITKEQEQAGMEFINKQLFDTK